MIRTFLIVFAILLIIGAAASGFYWSLEASIYCLASGAALLLGFGVTKGLIDSFVGNQKNPVVVIFLFLGKVAWWAGLFFASRMLPSNMGKPVTIAIFIFLLSLIATGLAHNGNLLSSKNHQST